MNYILMRKDDAVAKCEFDDKGNLLEVKEIIVAELMPLGNRIYQNGLSKWWDERAIPIKQGRIAKMLASKKIDTTNIYLVKNLGLSLTDYYWVKPEGTKLSWADVNLFTNDFKENILIGIELPDPQENAAPYKTPAFNPNSSLSGQLEKSWIIRDDERYLLKGNRNYLSQESLNEVIASRSYDAMGYDNYTLYKAVHINNRDYDYGCISKLFTNEKQEFVSAYNIVTSEKKPNDINELEHFINVCEKKGIDKNLLEKDLSYMFGVDFVLSNTDRHLSNFGILRDAETLNFIRLAPIYDSGKSLFVDTQIPLDIKDLLSLRINSFVSDETKILKHIKHPEIIQTSKLLSKETVFDILHKDTQMDPKKIVLICEAYEKKKELFYEFQQGKDLKKIRAELHKSHTFNKSDFYFEE